MSQSNRHQDSPVVHGLKLSSVVPGTITGDNRARELTGMDLAVKLHYLRGVYFFRAPDVPVDIESLKEPMFRTLELFYPVSGRVRRAETGRPFIKCNDSGVRIVEAETEKTVDEWLEMDDHAGVDDMALIYSHVLGPDLGFTPLVFIQFTLFKCGGISVGLSWAHVLGDAFSASFFLNMWGHIMAGRDPPKHFHLPPLGQPGTEAALQDAGSGKNVASSLRRIDPVGDHWVIADRCTMRTSSVHIARDHIDRLMPSHGKCSRFHVVLALIWKTLARIRGEGGARTVTVCAGSHHGGGLEPYLPGNRMIVGTVNADFPITETDVPELATWVASLKTNENHQVEGTVAWDSGQSDYVLYGANLTFVNLEDADIYGLKWKGQKPVYANYAIGGVGSEGVILVLPWKGKEREGLTITMTLAETEVSELKKELRTNPQCF
ncbi:hypothetical protein SAY86_004641 [Trapa natans]|uniref:Uncharacterized protein n=1 Tax=Trapa natans TaxID=22666 RepID=A0AAN7MGH1_TRANT|nr:hypothetical protein SAY86_004641 [Trapa natans]